MSISSLLTWTAMSSEQNDISEWDYLVKEYRNISKHITNQCILFLIISAPAKYYPLEQLAMERKPRLPIMCLNSFFHSASYPGRWQSCCSCDADKISFQHALCYLAEEGRQGGLDYGRWSQVDSDIFPHKVFLSQYKFGQFLRCFNMPLTHQDRAGTLITITKFILLAVPSKESAWRQQH